MVKISRVGSIARRYFAMNAFDGTLTILGVILGSHFALIRDPSVVVSAGIGACLAMMFSGLSGTYLAERAERQREYKEIEQAMLVSLDKSIVKRASHFAIIISSLVDGLSPFIAGLLCLSPFMAASLGLLLWDLAFIISSATAFTLLFALGVFLGRVSETNPWIYGLQTLATGLATAMAIILLATI